MKYHGYATARVITHGKENSMKHFLKTEDKKGKGICLRLRAVDLVEEADDKDYCYVTLSDARLKVRYPYYDMVDDVERAWK